MKPIQRGLVAGLVATVVLSALMLAKAAAGMLPQLNAVEMLAGLAAKFAGIGPSPVVGWFLHFAIGVILWGGLFGVAFERIPAAAAWKKGVLFGMAAWLIMMAVVMPLAGAGLFGLALGLGGPVATLILHIIFGAVLGATYAALPASPASAPRGRGVGVGP